MIAYAYKKGRVYMYAARTSQPRIHVVYINSSVAEVEAMWTLFQLVNDYHKTTRHLKKQISRPWISLVVSNWNDCGPQSFRRLFFLSLSPFIHNGWNYTDTTNPNPGTLPWWENASCFPPHQTTHVLNLNIHTCGDLHHGPVLWSGRTGGVWEVTGEVHWLQENYGSF